jgi:hypothetical protein
MVLISFCSPIIRQFLFSPFFWGFLISMFALCILCTKIFI